MNTLMHDFEVVSRIADLVSTLKGSYKVGNEFISVASANNLASFNVEFRSVYALPSTVKCSNQGEHDGQVVYHAWE
jgi:hypothetical protein